MDDLYSVIIPQVFSFPRGGSCFFLAHRVFESEVKVKLPLSPSPSDSPQPRGLCPSSRLCACLPVVVPSPRSLSGCGFLSTWTEVMGVSQVRREG